MPKQNSQGDFMNYSELHYILCIAKHQNLTRAAQELYISQPTLTKHLQKLEREMGAKLFSRNGNTYVPTYTGRKYMEYARKILQVKQDWEKELKDLTENWFLKHWIAPVSSPVYRFEAGTRRPV